MKIRIYHATSVADALALVKKDLGPDAFILDHKEVQARPKLGFFGKTCVEVTAAVDFKQDGAAPDENHAHDAGQPERGVLFDEVRELRALVQSIAASAARPPIVRASRSFRSPACMELYAELLYCGIEDEFAAELIERNAGDAEAAADKPEIESKALADLATRLPMCNGIPPYPVASPQVVALIGPTGVGKTTTIAKLAAKAVLEHKLRVGLVTNDTFRIAAAEQLRTYAEIIGIPLRIAQDAAELEQSIQELSDRDVILIDTAGRGQRDGSGRTQLADLFASIPGLTKALTLSATTKQSDVEDILDKYKTLDPKWLIFTKLDETEAHGCIVNGILRSALPLAYVTIGQAVPQDITQPSALDIAQLALGRAKPGAWRSFLEGVREAAHETEHGYEYPQLIRRNLEVVR